MIDKLRKQWKGKQRGFISALLNIGGGVRDHHAENMTQDAEMAMSVSEIFVLKGRQPTQP
jgi:hypothetical protein